MTTTLMLIMTLATMLLICFIVVMPLFTRRKTNKYIDDTREQLEIERETDELLRFMLEARNSP